VSINKNEAGGIIFAGCAFSCRHQDFRIFNYSRKTSVRHHSLCIYLNGYCTAPETATASLLDGAKFILDQVGTTTRTKSFNCTASRDSTQWGPTVPLSELGLGLDIVKHANASQKAFQVDSALHVNTCLLIVEFAIVDHEHEIRKSIRHGPW
jgi:hypothetical protein